MDGFWACGGSEFGHVLWTFFWGVLWAGFGMYCGRISGCIENDFGHVFWTGFMKKVCACIVVGFGHALTKYIPKPTHNTLPNPDSIHPHAYTQYVPKPSWNTSPHLLTLHSPALMQYIPTHALNTSPSPNEIQSQAYTQYIPKP